MKPDFQLFPEQASTIAASVDHLYLFLIALTVFFVLFIFGLVVFFAIRYRRRNDDEQPEAIEGNHALEIAWSVIPLIIVMVIFVWGTSLFLEMVRQPADATPIYVVGKQWMWKIQHPDGHSEINQLHVPVGHKFQLVMTSEDVIHSFYIPAFRVKQDVVPGRYSSAWFEATKEGTYHLFCAEYCGTSHSGMRGEVIVMSAAAYEDWLGGETGSSSMADAGEKLYTGMACSTCHSDDSEGRGPSLRGLFERNVILENGKIITPDEAYVRESILEPQAKTVRGFGPIMPTYEGQLSEEQILQIIAYIKTLKPLDDAAGEQP